MAHVLPAAAPGASVAFSTYFTAFASGAFTDRSGAEPASALRMTAAASGITAAPTAMISFAIAELMFVRAYFATNPGRGVSSRRNASTS